jgi:AraC-like DNA-binding protein
MAYLRRVRLEQAHRDLRDATAADVTVTAVASRWGFTASRFTEHYRAAYGQLPSQTLRS